MSQLYCRVSNKNNGYDSDKELIKSLDSGKFHIVERVSMGQSSTSIKIKDCDFYFNSVNLTFYKKDGESYIEHDIYSDPEYNPYIKGLRGLL